ncbi:hypothetical protein GFB56_32970 [Ensifer sp. T173]|uniref:Uncharacterized protein n=1 Tax=Ensifer canadensis TaxID=555315 RepID=A0AAW4FW39_9HYPH|nr:MULTISPECIES: hypothetical protein [Ensifer]KQY77029.1 hypothetical protein ASD52_23870 [Ensifer sp. Root142]MBM3095536.1 hypothetical protein [Ensifer canadensis]UBI79867.1 hypothetical protein J3R84_29915 [Ensifer canadensis]
MPITLIVAKQTNNRGRSGQGGQCKKIGRLNPYARPKEKFKEHVRMDDPDCLFWRGIWMTVF